VRNHGTPVFPQRYFERLIETFGDQSNILTVFRKNEPISSVLSFYFRDRVLPYYAGGTADARASGANDLMYWQLMRHAHTRGCTSFDFGRSKLGTGPYAFKKNWGFEPRPIAHWYYLLRRQSLPNISPANPKYGMAIKAWRALPLPVANFVSQFISPDLA
jgi:FemAB-related protein (PEP-CTERM system-associated)